MLQKVIEKVENTSLLDQILELMCGNIADLVNNTNGNHVIQKFLNKLGSDKSNFIYNEIAEKCKEIGIHKHGCCVLQRCYDNSTMAQKIMLTQRIIEHTDDFVRDQYGNYVIQFVLKLDGFDSYKTEIGDRIKENLVELSKQKFSSNVIEVCLETELQVIVEKLIEILSQPGTMIQMFCDGFGNYVIQKILKIYEGNAMVMPIVMCIKMNLDALKLNEISAKALQKLPKAYEFLDSNFHGSVGNFNKEFAKPGNTGTPKGGHGSQHHMAGPRGDPGATSGGPPMRDGKKSFGRSYQDFREPHQGGGGGQHFNPNQGHDGHQNFRESNRGGPDSGSNSFHQYNPYQSQGSGHGHNNNGPPQNQGGYNNSNNGGSGRNFGPNPNQQYNGGHGDRGHGGHLHQDRGQHGGHRGDGGHGDRGHGGPRGDGGGFVRGGGEYNHFQGGGHRGGFNQNNHSGPQPGGPSNFQQGPPHGNSRPIQRGRGDHNNKFQSRGGGRGRDEHGFQQRGGPRGGPNGGPRNSEDFHTGSRGGRGGPQNREQQQKDPRNQGRHGPPGPQDQIAMYNDPRQSPQGPHGHNSPAMGPPPSLGPPPKNMGPRQKNSRGGHRDKNNSQNNSNDNMMMYNNQNSMNVSNSSNLNNSGGPSNGNSNGNPNMMGQNQSYPVNMNMNLNFNVNYNYPNNYPNLESLSLQDKKNTQAANRNNQMSNPNMGNQQMGNPNMKWNN